MYHRNKVHTDEFWRYELTKNRRSFVDTRVNEDLWKKQLGKHGEEVDPPMLKQENTSANPTEAKEEQIKWLEQINRSSSSQMSPEMKLFALQSLQKSLQSMQYMSPPASTETSNTEKESSRRESASSHSISQPAVPNEVPAIKQEVEAPNESYLALLAHISRRESSDPSGQDGKVEGDPLLPTKEESAANRTQTWLAQVTKYRTSSIIKEENNHDQLWEQQIARIKNNPVRSPLEPVEITLDDLDDTVVVPNMKSTILSTSNINNNNNNSNNNNDSVYNTQCLPVQPPTPALIAEQFPARLSAERCPPRLSEEVEELEDQSLLKSLLLDRLKRKRSGSSDSAAATREQAKKPGKTPPPLATTPPSPAAPTFDAPKEILRKRLLGWVSQPEVPAPTQPIATLPQAHQPIARLAQAHQPIATPAQAHQPIATPAKAHQRSQQPLPAFNLTVEETLKEEGQEERVEKKEEVSYTQTSVLKHLLYRYTGVRKQ